MRRVWVAVIYMALALPALLIAAWYAAVGAFILGGFS